MKAYNISFLFLKSNKNFCGLEKKAIPERIKPDTANLTIVKKGVERLVLENKSCPHIPEIAHNYNKCTYFFILHILTPYVIPKKGKMLFFYQINIHYILYFVNVTGYNFQPLP